VQEAAYDSLLKRTRELHGRVVDVLVAVSGAPRRRRKWWHGPRRWRGGTTMRSPPTRTPAR